MRGDLARVRRFPICGPLRAQGVDRRICVTRPLCLASRKVVEQERLKTRFMEHDEQPVVGRQPLHRSVILVRFVKSIAVEEDCFSRKFAVVQFVNSYALNSALHNYQWRPTSEVDWPESLVLSPIIVNQLLKEGDIPDARFALGSAEDALAIGPRIPRHS
jgi:hypothetical protein